MLSKGQSALLAALLTLASGCTGTDYDSSTPSEVRPDILLVPDRVDFGELEVAAATPAVETIELRNEGDDALHLLDLVLEDEDAPFEIAAQGDLLIPAGGSSWLQLSFTPLRDATHDTNLVIHSDDPLVPRASLQLLGTGLAPELSIDREVVDFGEDWVGCEGSVELELNNTGSLELLILEAEVVGGSSWVSVAGLEDNNGGDEGLVELAPGESVTASVTSFPLTAGSHEAILTLASNDPHRPAVSISFEASAQVWGSQVDSFVPGVTHQPDLLVAVDKSASMADEHLLLLDGMAALLEELRVLGSDFRVAITANDDGCVNGSDLWVDAGVTDADAVLALETMLNPHGAVGSNTERAFMLFEAALLETPAGGCNEGLLRSDASLHLLAVSDDAEQSVNSWSYYLEQFQEHVGGSGQLFVHAVGGDYPHGCDGAAFYSGVYEATVETAGLFLSICEADWTAGFQALAQVLANCRFLLSERPVPDTIEVRVEGITVEGWSYDRDSNAVVFDQGEAAPEFRETVEIEYTLQGECSG